MKVSIITTTMNSEATVADTLNCVKGQSYENIEHIIIDGNSSDRTLGIVNQYDHIAKIISEPDKGIYDAMNKGISECTGDIIAILNSDDVYVDSNVIRNIVNAFQTQNVDSVYGNLVYVDQHDLNKKVRTWISKPYKKSNWLFGWMPPHPSFFVKREVYEEHGGFNTSLRSAADYEIMLRFLYKRNISVHYINEVLVKMRRGGVSNSSFLNRIRANKEDRMAWKKNDLQSYFFTTSLKPIRKVHQFFI